MITLQKIQERIVEAIKLSGMTQTEIAKKVGVKQPTVGQYLSGRSLPALDTFARLCQVLDVSPEYLLGLSDTL